MLDNHSGTLSHRLAAHLASLDLPKGAHLIEQALADQMAVSRTPIRRALAEFAKAGIVYSEPRRGYFMAVASRALFTSELDFEIEGQDDLFARIALDRLSEQLENEFSEADIIARYEVSSRLAQRTLQTLRDENVVEPAGRGIWRFNPFLLTKEASDASYVFRRIIEPQIPLLPTFRPRPDLIRQCRDEHLRLLALPAQERTGRLAFRVDAMFHETVAICGNNFFFHSSVVQQSRLRQLMEYRNSAQEMRVIAWVREHLDVLDAITAGAFKTASSLLEAHLSHAVAHRS
jgi:DNA-binding GntR family transcriptional regulator